MEYYSVIKKNKILLFAATQMDLENIMLSEISQTEKDECCMISLLCTVQPVHSEGDQPWDFFGRNDAEAETRVLWPPHAKS